MSSSPHYPPSGTAEQKLTGPQIAAGDTGLTPRQEADIKVSLDPRAVAAQRRAAADRDARLARLGDRAARVVSLLTDPTAHGGRAEDAFDLVLPSLPGYGASAEPTEVGWDAGRIARAWAELMDRLGYTHYVAQGGDQGAGVTDALGRQAPDGLAGLHLNFLRDAVAGGSLSPGPRAPEPSAAERAALDAIAAFRTGGFGYFLEQATRPQTIGYALLDSPVALATWMLDHDTDSYYKISRAFVGGQAAGGLTRDHVLDNITLYWLTGATEIGAAFKSLR